MPLTPMNRITSVTIDTRAELKKIAAAKGVPAIRKYAMGDVFRIYQNMKTLRFFQAVFDHFNNKEATKQQSLRTYDIFKAEVWKGEIFFIVEASWESVEAFLDDGFVIFKIKEWLIESYKKAVSDMRQAPDADPVKLWDDAFMRTGSPLPDDVMVIPFYHEEFVPGVPAVTLALVKPK
jgi:hypothetical protein